ncbi:cell division protein ZapA [Peteryoungia desertarenae]|uniref:Cell division protein ZapA n=1 Tax=Peteryoungia desertarenae TaxID=1813451 RepID=A0ABX6QRQ2_9HYPH|nr:cell division protein ZapA [Peteryoungia desertarenae]QLF71189.1 cell division protein ZapA [Peteryoungia desertarenae]
MAQVTVTIDGKAYRMACEEGQEDHLTSLATDFDRYVTHLKAQFGEIGDLRITVMAGIMVMDELSDIKRRVAALEHEMVGLRAGREEVMNVVDHREAQVVEVLDELTQHINGITRKLTARAAPEARPGN